MDKRRKHDNCFGEKKEHSVVITEKCISNIKEF